jgi:hypothetical protein
MNNLSDIDQALLFLLVTACLGASFIRLFWEFERSREHWLRGRSSAGSRGAKWKNGLRASRD